MIIDKRHDSVIRRHRLLITVAFKVQERVACQPTLIYTSLVFMVFYEILTPQHLHYCQTLQTVLQPSTAHKALFAVDVDHNGSRAEDNLV